MVETVDSWIPLQHRETVHGLARDMDSAIAGFVRGQAVICLILAVFYAVGLTLVGLNVGVSDRAPRIARNPPSAPTNGMKLNRPVIRPMRNPDLSPTSVSPTA